MKSIRPVHYLYALLPGVIPVFNLKATRMIMDWYGCEILNSCNAFRFGLGRLLLLSYYSAYFLIAPGVFVSVVALVYVILSQFEIWFTKRRR